MDKCKAHDKETNIYIEGKPACEDCILVLVSFDMVCQNCIAGLIHDHLETEEN